MFSRQKIILAKIETDYGQYASPTPQLNAIDAEDVKINYVGEVIERQPHRGHFSPVKPVMGKRHMELSFSVEIKGSGEAGRAPALGAILQACGFSETINAEESVVYSPTSSLVKSLSFAIFEPYETGGAKLHKMTGARGTVTFSFEAGQRGKIDFNFRGLFNEAMDVTMPAPPVYEDTLPPLVEIAGFTLNNNSNLLVQSVSLDLQNELSNLDDINSASGMGQFRLTGRNPSGNFNPEAVSVASYNFLFDWEQALSRSLILKLGAQEGNQLTVTAPHVTLDGISEGDRNGIRIEEIPFRLSGADGDDELVLTFS